MLIIRQAQMKALGEASQRQFELRMLAYLRTAFAAHIGAQPDEGVLAMIREGIGDAEGYGIVNESELGRYIEFMVLRGRDFHRKPWAAAILRTKGLNGVQKMDRIDEYDLFAKTDE